MYPQETGVMAGYDPGPELAEAADAPVTGALRQLELEVDRAEKAVMYLQGRLDPVLQQGPEAADSRGPEGRPSFEVPLADHIALLTTRLRTALSHLDRTTNRIAL